MKENRKKREKKKRQMNQANETVHFTDSEMNCEATGENNHKKERVKHGFREAAKLQLNATVKSCVQLRRDIGLGYKTAGLTLQMGEERNRETAWVPTALQRVFTALHLSSNTEDRVATAPLAFCCPKTDI